MESQPNTQPMIAPVAPPQQDCKLRRQSPVLCGPAADITAEAEIGGVAKAEQADIADQQIERAGKEREAQDLHQEDRVEDKRRHYDGEEKQQRADALRAGITPLRQHRINRR